ncbi:DNA-binding response OmpR family regulator [Salirhabdus euzebyi]|uniref:DNA-binding response OmpR family regulator n=1 Tax=Salirhabdus euzebyi TaxID=394506 RepID=A0A841Q7D0_9BACI|nr:response regulator transcription factor [Salirhabdus euzebyi]MBB6454469.1 DNA-binding response OmpR family regulator [Salirhabdus euzebyi]
MSLTILIVEDDYDIQHFLSTALSSYGFHPIIVSHGMGALHAFELNQPDLILLDVQLPDLNGFDVCESIRKVSNVPIIFVSCLDDGSDIIRGLELGGDDYVTKPFDLQQLIARIKSNLRRAPVFNRQNDTTSQPMNLDTESLKIGPLHLNFYLQRVTFNNQNIDLSNKEFLILSILAQHPDKIFSAHELYTLIWGTDSLGETRTLKVHISNLRKKLELHTGVSTYIQTVRGLGYQFCIK